MAYRPTKKEDGTDKGTVNLAPDVPTLAQILPQEQQQHF